VSEPAPISDEMRAAVAEAMEGQKQVETIADGPDGPVKTYTDGTTEAVIVKQD